LRNAGSKVEDSAEIAEDLTPERKSQGVIIGLGMLGVVLATLRSIADVPAQHAGCTDHKNCEAVHDGGLESGGGYLV
jgi:hypothetical protein